MNVRFKNRIASYNAAVVALIILIVFIVVYAVVSTTAYRHLDHEIRQEKEDMTDNINWKEDSLVLIRMGEFVQDEHSPAEVNPIFLQVVDVKHRLLFRSPSLLNDHLRYADSLREPVFFNIELNGKLIRQGQFPIINVKGKLLGQLDIGISQVESTLILRNLRLTFFIAFPFILLVFFFATSWAASRGIAPMNDLIRVAGTINDKNISTRIPLPPHRDEIHQLTTTMNELLQRIEESLIREKQITADISHELRTPITVIRGTLEVLIRKKREPEQYEEKIRTVIHEVDTLNKVIDQLLQLSRIDAGMLSFNITSVPLLPLLEDIKVKRYHLLSEKEMSLQIIVPEQACVYTDPDFLRIILENLIGNAIKYGFAAQPVTCTWDEQHQRLSVSDKGPGIPADQIPLLFNRFYRADSSRNSGTDGVGLGLSIVKNLADMLGISVSVDSREDYGTTFTLTFSI